MTVGKAAETVFRWTAPEGVLTLLLLSRNTGVECFVPKEEP